MYINIDTRETNRYRVVAESTEPEDRQPGFKSHLCHLLCGDGQAI